MMTQQKRKRPGQPPKTQTLDAVGPFALALRQARETKGLTRRQVAEVIGVTEQTVGNLETRPAPESIVTCLRLASLLGFSLDGVAAGEPLITPEPLLSDAPRAGELILELLRAGSVAEVARQRGTSRQAVSRQLRDAGLDAAAIIDTLKTIRRDCVK